jgi:mannose-6-phosphate isomerase-like protein (cupin superfamily)
MSLLQQPISPESSKLALAFHGKVSPNVNGPAYFLYPEKEDSHWKQFQPFRYNYLVPIVVGGKRGGKAGHYHHHKTEVFCLLTGDVEIWLEEVSSGKREIIKMLGVDSGEVLMLGIPAGVAHYIRNTGKIIAQLLIFANRQSEERDELPFAVFKE